MLPSSISVQIYKWVASREKWTAWFNWVREKYFSDTLTLARDISSVSTILLRTHTLWQEDLTKIHTCNLNQSEVRLVSSEFLFILHTYKISKNLKDTLNTLSYVIISGRTDSPAALWLVRRGMRLMRWYISIIVFLPQTFQRQTWWDALKHWTRRHQLWK